MAIKWKFNPFTSKLDATQDPLEAITHADLSDMPDVGGTNTDHDARYLQTETDPIVGAITGIVKANGAGIISSAVADTDYVYSLYKERASQNLTAVSSTISVTDGSPVSPITSNGTYTLTSAPTIANGRDGQMAILINTGSYAVTIQDMGTLGGSNLRLGATTRTLSANRGSIKLVYDSTMSGWVEHYFNNVLTFTASVSGLTIDGSSAATREVAAASTDDAVPSFVVTYVGVPSTASIDIDAGGGEESGSDYPITLPSPYTSLNSGTTPPSKKFYKGSSVAQVRTFTITATVSGTGGLQRTCTVTYYNSRYGGINTQTTALSSAQTVALGNLATDNAKYGSMVVNSAGTNYYWYCYRSALGTITYWSVNSERADFTRIGTGTVNVTNASGFIETFEQYRSTIICPTGSVTVTASSSAANNRIYMGPSSDTDPITTAHILALDDDANGTSRLGSSVAASYTVTIGTGKYLWFCHPSSISDLATIKDHTTGFGIDGSYKTNITHTNDMGYAETYRCWRSTNTGIFPSANVVDVT